MSRSKFVLAASVVAVFGCKTPAPSGTDLASTPSANGTAVDQGQRVVNRCDAGGHAGPTTGTGWLFDAEEGCFQDCRDLSALKADFLAQLKRHRVYGDPDVVASVDPDGAAMMRRYQESLDKIGLEPSSFKKLTTDKLFDGAKWQELGIQPGDIFLNMNFGQPNNAGVFYSKRGLAHARMVVEVTPTEIVTFDGGWERFSRIKQPNAQTVWLRPRAAFLKNGDLANVVKWAKGMEKAKYDNTLVDDWKEFRIVLNKLLDEGKSQVEARNGAFAWAKANGKAPGSFEDSFAFMPPSGIYCSEGTAAIYSYLGMRQHGETAIDVITAWGANGELPDWSIYANALAGFGAGGDQKTYMMHELFYNYFRMFDLGRKAGAIKVPGLADAQAATFAQAVEANFKAVEADGGAGDHIQKQLDAFLAAMQAQGGSEAQVAQMVELKKGLAKAVAALSQASGKELNFTQAVYTMFYGNKSYGPHSFFENGKHFELKGVFYNTDLASGGQALFVVNWDLNVIGQPSQAANISTTLYRVKNDNSLPANECVMREKAPNMSAR